MASPIDTQSKQKSDVSHSVGVNVTTKAESTRIGEGLEVNPWYFKSIPGILKIIELIFAIICMACGSRVVTNYTHFFMFVVSIYFIMTLVLCVAYLFALRKLFPKLPWLFTELLMTASAVALYFIAMVVQLERTAGSAYYYPLRAHGYYGQYIAAGVFALFNMLVYAAGTFFLFMEWKESRQATSPAPN